MVLLLSPFFCHGCAFAQDCSPFHVCHTVDWPPPPIMEQRRATTSHLFISPLHSHSPPSHYAALSCNDHFVFKSFPPPLMVFKALHNSIHQRPHSSPSLAYKTRRRPHLPRPGSLTLPSHALFLYHTCCCSSAPHAGKLRISLKLRMRRQCSALHPGAFSPTPGRSPRPKPDTPTTPLCQPCTTIRPVARTAPMPHSARLAAQPPTQHHCRDAPLLSTCSQMRWVKNKATQLLIIKDLRPSKHYLLTGIMLHRRRLRRTYLHHINMRVGMWRNKYGNYILIHILLHFIKHEWISIMLILHWYLRLARRWGCERVNTIQHEQYDATVHLFIGTRYSPGKSIFMSLTSIYNHNMNH
jgi:hypothetical protein